MLKIENVDIFGWKCALRGMRNPKQSFNRQDSEFEEDFKLGENDSDLAKRLINAGPEHRKFLRMIHVQFDITLPSYVVAEFDTYKIATTRNSYSFMHKGTSSPYNITDFTFEPESLSKNALEIIEPFYPYETDEYKVYTLSSGRHIKVFKNGKVRTLSFEYIKDGETFTTKERNLVPVSQNGQLIIYPTWSRYDVIPLASLVANAWRVGDELDFRDVIHKDKNKGNCSVENLELGNLVGEEYNWVNFDNFNEMINRSSYVIDNIIDQLNVLRNIYLDTKDESVFRLIRQILPSGYNIKFTWDGNYETLLNMYKQRKNHRLPEWKEFCSWIETLPYMKDFINAKLEVNP